MPANIFEPTANGYAGRVRLFGIDEAIVLVAIEPGDGENTPVYRVHVDDEDGPDIGGGWKRVSAPSRAESLADEVAPFGIRTTIVEPGAFRTKPPKDRGRSVFPENLIEDYADATEKMIASVKGFNGHEPGHRKKLASAFVSVVDMEQPPRRWVAGQDAVDGIVAKAHRLIADATAFPELSTTLAHDD